nr:MAG TPA: hypothetical protein [Caudoviricetes sp.]
MRERGGGGIGDGTIPLTRPLVVPPPFTQGRLAHAAEYRKHPLFHLIRRGECEQGESDTSSDTA